MGQTYEVSHRKTVPGVPLAAYELVADVSLWPVLFGPTIDIQVMEHEEDSGVASERFCIHALVGDAVRQWRSRRRLDRPQLVIEFEQEHQPGPLAAMSGSWEFQSSGDATTIVLIHRFVPADDSPPSVRRILDALDVNSERELGAIGRVTAGRQAPMDLVVTCEDSVPVVEGADAYDFVDRADRWPELLPHVERADLRLVDVGVQDLRLTTVVPGGDVHHTRSIRICTPRRRIAYKQLQPPAGLMGHSGTWTFSPEGNGESTATSHHLVLLDPAAAAAADDLGALRARVAGALSANSRATLSRAATFLTDPPGNR